MNSDDSTGAIQRSKRSQVPFAMIPNALFADETLTWKAKAILGYLLSKPDGWKLIVADLCKRSQDGERAVRSGLGELRDAGYLNLRQTRINGSTITGHVWDISYFREFQPNGPLAKAQKAKQLQIDVSSKCTSATLNKTDSNKKELSEETKESPTGKPVRRTCPSGGQQVVNSMKVLNDTSKLTKPQLLERIKPRKGTPSFDVVQKHIETLQLDYVANSNAHEELRANKFHVWNEAKRCWQPVMHWKLFLEGLNLKMLKAANKANEGRKRVTKRPMTYDEAKNCHQSKPEPKTKTFEPTNEPASAFLAALKQNQNQ